MSAEKNLEQEIQNHLTWMESLIADGTGAAVAGETSEPALTEQVDDLIKSISSDQSQRAPKVSDVFHQYSSLMKDAYQSTANPAEERQYRISDIRDDDEEESSDCEDYYVEDAAEIRGQEIPAWARATNLLQALQRQQRVDPDKIFVNFARTCDLSQMFETKKRSFKIRGDSGWWANDGLTENEEMNYKRALGFE